MLITQLVLQLKQCPSTEDLCVSEQVYSSPAYLMFLPGAMGDSELRPSEKAPVGNVPCCWQDILNAAFRISYSQKVKEMVSRDFNASISTKTNSSFVHS